MNEGIFENNWKVYVQRKTQEKLKYSKKSKWTEIHEEIKIWEILQIYFLYKNIDWKSSSCGHKIKNKITKSKIERQKRLKKIE